MEDAEKGVYNFTNNIDKNYTGPQREDRHHCCPTKFGIAITGCYVMVFFVFPDKKVRLNPAVQT